MRFLGIERKNLLQEMILDKHFMIKTYLAVKRNFRHYSTLSNSRIALIQIRLVNLRFMPMHMSSRLTIVPQILS